MAGKVLELDSILVKDELGCKIATQWQTWDSFRVQWKSDKEEISRYIFATDTTQTTNSKLPWKNKTTIPKLCQIRDNLYANYTASSFPNPHWLDWVADNPSDADKQKADTIKNYMAYVIKQSHFKAEMDKIILDYIDYGNCFAMPEWIDQRVTLPDKTQVGYVGPSLRRISPLDIVFNPTAESFDRSPKIIRSLVSVGEVKEMLLNLSTDETRQDYADLWEYLKGIRSQAQSFPGDTVNKDNLFNVDGFSGFREYLDSDYVEILTFYGDIYDSENDDFLKNYKIMVVDRHKVIVKKPNPSFFGYPPIYHIAWRKRQDNLWGMGPLDNLVGMQYRIDHLENLKADIFDLTAFPVIKVKGLTEDFNWGPNERIYVSDDGDVEMLSPDVQALQANIDIQNLERLMEEMAGAPREAVGFRTPGEKTKYEVQRLENAASRVYQNKIKQFEEQLTEPALNALLELARRNVSSAFTINVWDEEFKMQTFQELTVADITGSGKIKPIAARHFAEQAELVQNLTNLANSTLFPLIEPHISGIATANMFESIFNMEDYKIIMPYIAISERAEAQKLMQITQENAQMQATTPSGLNPDDVDNAPTMDQTPQGPQG